MKMWKNVLAAAVLMSGMSSLASAVEITFTGDYAFLNGTGNGPIQGVLSLQQQGSSDYEWGYSGWSTTSGVGGTLTGGPGTASHSWSSSTSQRFTTHTC